MSMKGPSVVVLGYILLFHVFSLQMFAFAYLPESSSLQTRSRREVHIFNSYNHRVFIEDTDSFGVVYNANYPLYIERAILDAPNPRIVKFKSLKYKAPARLGDNLEVLLTTNEKDPLKLNAKILKQGECTELMSCMGIVHQKSSCRINGERIKFEEKNYAGESPIFTSHFVVYPDEKTHINTFTTATVFKLFERARTNMLGGPTSLLELSLGNVHVYVARVSDYEILKDVEMNVNKNQVVVKSICKPLGSLEGGVSMVNFNQFVCNVSDMMILSKAVVTCSCVDATTDRAASFPSEIARKFF